MTEHGKVPDVEHMEYEEEIGRLQKRNADLLAALEGTIRALQQHVSEEARHQDTTPHEVCPCQDAEIAQARATIARAKGG